MKHLRHNGKGSLLRQHLHVPSTREVPPEHMREKQLCCVVHQNRNCHRPIDGGRSSPPSVIRPLRNVGHPVIDPLPILPTSWAICQHPSAANLTLSRQFR